METRFTILLIEIGIAVTVQACVLIGILITVRKSTARMSTMAEEIQKRAIPTLENVQKLVEFTRPRVEAAVENLTQASNSVRTQVEKLDLTVNDFMDRAKIQVVRADDLVTRTLDRVETTTEVVNQHGDLARPLHRRNRLRRRHRTRRLLPPLTYLRQRLP